MKCPYCSDSIHPNAKFCPKCGLGLKDEATMMGSYVEEESGPNRWVVAAGAGGIVTIALLIGWMSGGGSGRQAQSPAPLPASASTASIVSPVTTAPLTGGTTPAAAPGFTQFPSPTPSWSGGAGYVSTPTTPVSMTPAPVPPLGYTAPERRPQKPKPQPEPEVLAPPQMATVQQMMRRSDRAEVAARFSVLPSTPDFGSTLSPLQKMGLDPEDRRRADQARMPVVPSGNTVWTPEMMSSVAGAGIGAGNTPGADMPLGTDMAMNGPADNRTAAAARARMPVEGENSPWVYDPVHERWARNPNWGEPKRRVVRSEVDTDRTLRSGRVRVSPPLNDR
ncbi:MAG: hypothetical protein ACK47B_10585 [Armatimonadota bacterium]